MLLGFDIGGTKCAVILGQKETGNTIGIVEKAIIPTAGPALNQVNTLISHAHQLLNNNSVRPDQLTGIGISCGGPLDSARGIILSPPNLPGWNNIPIVDLLEQAFGIRPVLQNDANACAVAEWQYGAGRGFTNMIFLTFGTGIGAGLIFNNQLYSGTSDSAGEVGHIRLAQTGPIGFGKAGSFEGFCSGGGIARLARSRAMALIEAGIPPSFCLNAEGLSSITAQSVTAAAYNGDPIAIDIYKNCGHYLGMGLSVLIDILNPELIVIGGIFCHARSLLEPAMNEVLNNEALPVARNVCRILPAALGAQIGDYAALSLAGMRYQNSL